MDLKEVIGKKIEQGHQIILMGDFNSEYSELESWMLELGLQDLIGKKHGKGPKTYNRSKDAPIDCVFGSASLQISKGGFLSFGRLMSDHRGVWVDIPKFLLYGYNPPQPLQVLLILNSLFIWPRIKISYPTQTASVNCLGWILKR